MAVGARRQGAEEAELAEYERKYKSFHRFSDLPVVLQLEIWEHAIEELVRQVLDSEIQQIPTK